MDKNGLFGLLYDISNGINRTSRALWSDQISANNAYETSNEFISDAIDYTDGMDEGVDLNDAQMGTAAQAAIDMRKDLESLSDSLRKRQEQVGHLIAMCDDLIEAAKATPID